jgi:hypothetical protein
MIIFRENKSEKSKQVHLVANSVYVYLLLADILLAIGQNDQGPACAL